MGVGGLHHGESFDHGPKTERDVFALLAGGLFD